MHRQFISFVSALAFIMCPITMTYAQDNHFASSDPFANRNAAHVGLYLKIPFSGGLKNFKKDRLKFGASLGFKRNYSSDYRTNIEMFNSRRQITLNVLDLKFNEHGFKTVSLVGQDLRGLKKGDIIFLEDEKGGITAGKVVLYTLAGLGALVLVAAAAVATDDCAFISFDPKCN